MTFEPRATRRLTQLPREDPFASELRCRNLCSGDGKPTCDAAVTVKGQVFSSSLAQSTS